MITFSDDAAADVLWQQAGGPKLEPWIEEHYGLPELGSLNVIIGRWGNTNVTALGLAQLYAVSARGPGGLALVSAALHGMQARA